MLHLHSKFIILPGHLLLEYFHLSCKQSLVLTSQCPYPWLHTFSSRPADFGGPTCSSVDTRFGKCYGPSFLSFNAILGAYDRNVATCCDTNYKLSRWWTSKTSRLNARICSSAELWVLQAVSQIILREHMMYLRVQARLYEGFKLLRNFTR